jgi:peptidoglycan/xylan/chitin deacetylase (PgdA/CDA1 family)
VISDQTGRRPTYYRPPYGVFSAAGLALARRSGCIPLLWSRWGKDWAAHATPSGIARNVGSDLLPGDIVLLHDSDAYSSPASWRKMVSALPEIVEAAARTGEPLVSVSHSR